MEKQNKYTVIVSEKARQMLGTHASFLYYVSRSAAERLVDSFVKAANSLDTMPQRCPWFNNEIFPRNAYRFILFEKRYMLLFQIQDSNVYVDYVLDCRQDHRLLFQNNT